MLLYSDEKNHLVALLLIYDFGILIAYGLTYYAFIAHS